MLEVRTTYNITFLCNLKNTHIHDEGINYKKSVGGIHQDLLQSQDRPSKRVKITFISSPSNILSSRISQREERKISSYKFFLN